MNRKSVSVALTCAFGAFIGYFTAAQIASSLHFYQFIAGTIGMVVGGSVAYCAIDFRQLCSSVARAYDSTIRWRPYMPFWQTVPLMSMLGSLISFYLLILGLGLHIEVNNLKAVNVFFSLDFFMAALVFMLLGAIIATMTFVSELSGMPRNSKTSDKLFKERRNLWKAILWLNPVGLIIFACRAILLLCLLAARGIIWTEKNATAIARSIFRGIARFFEILASFVKQVFVLVHSDLRQLCFIDAALGTAIGWYFHNVFCGTAAGAILGLVSYELVTVRLLKLARAK